MDGLNNTTAAATRTVEVWARICSSIHDQYCKIKLRKRSVVRSSIVKLGCAILLGGLILCLLGCSTTATPRTSSLKFSGFLEDYGELDEVDGSEALYLYSKPYLNLDEYSKLLIREPVLMLTEETLDEIGTEQLEKLLTRLYDKNRPVLERRVEMVDVAGPGTIELRWAITELEPSSKLNVLTGVIPPARMTSLILREGGDVHLFLGKVSLEGEILDATTGERLAAAVLRRVGNNAIQNVGSTWGDIEDAFSHWTELFITKLEQYGFRMIPHGTQETPERPRPPRQSSKMSLRG
jgi:hypothetical protein